MYSDIINQKIGRVYQKGVANKILQSMDRIRNEYDEVQARRWPTELLQNARDLAFSDEPVRVQFELTDDCVYFRHSGKPFSVRDILSIINQVSSKKPGEGIGQFGTGFMSTFQLSMQVTVRSYLKDEGEPYKRFEVCLDRSGTTHEAISQAISQALDSLRMVDRTPDEATFDRSQLNTEFCYHLTQKQSKKIARIGMEDLRRTLIYTMLFSEQIGQVELLFHTADFHQEFVFRRGTAKEISPTVERQEILVGDEIHTCFLTKQDDFMLAAEWNQATGYLPLRSDAPRLYIDFPLVGSENFPFPVVINSRALRPNEPRSGISLVEHEQSLDAATNRRLIDKAVAVYAVFFAELRRMDQRGIEHLVEIIPQEECKEWSASWVRKHIYDALYQTLSHQNILPVDGTYRTLADSELVLICHEDPEIREKLSLLCAQLSGFAVPESGVDWYHAFSGYVVPEAKSLTLRRVLEQASKLSAKGFRGETTVISWLADLYDLSMMDEQTKTGMFAGEFAILPNQNRSDLNLCKLYTVKELSCDPKIPEVLKDIAECLDELEESGALKIRSRLLHREFAPKQGIPLAEYPLSVLIDHIAGRSSEGFRVRNFSWYASTYRTIWRNAWKQLIAVGGEKDLYELARALWSDLPAYEPCDDERFPERMWGNAYRGMLTLLIDLVRERKSDSALKEYLQKMIPDFDPMEWLNLLYRKIPRYLQSSDYYYKEILPNQYGELRHPSNLKLDQIDDEKLKEIAVSLRSENSECDVKKELVMQGLSMDGWTISGMKMEHVTAHINAALQRILARTSLSNASEEIQNACTQLLSWIRRNPETAQQHFPMFCRDEDQMKLLTPNAAVGLQKKADQLQDVMEFFGTDDVDGIKEKFQQMQQEYEKMQKNLLQFGETQSDMGGSGYYDSETGMYLDSDWINMDDAIRKERMRRIGTGGERCIFRMLGEHFTSQGFSVQSRTDHLAVYENVDSGERVTVHYPDTEEYKQSGWDISVRFERSDGTQMDYLIEVKTHTATSKVRSLLPLSNKQMQKAAKLGDQFILLLVIYNEVLNTASKVYEFRNVISHLATGKLSNAEDKYCLYLTEE